MEYLKIAVENGPEILAALIGLLSSIVAIALLIPGEQPEKSLSKIIAFLEKFSRK